MSAPAGSGDHLVLRGELKGHNGWVTSIATTMTQPDMLLTASRGPYTHTQTQHTDTCILRMHATPPLLEATAPALARVLSPRHLFGDENDMFLFSESPAWAAEEQTYFDTCVSENIIHYHTTITLQQPMPCE